jgi:hypothetical protein
MKLSWNGWERNKSLCRCYQKKQEAAHKQESQKKLCSTIALFVPCPQCSKKTQKHRHAKK